MLPHPIPATCEYKVASVRRHSCLIDATICCSHEEALEHAKSAVYYGQELDEAGTRAGAVEGGGEARLLSSPGGGNGSRRARLATLAISYYNLAVELEYTHRYEACLRW